MSSATGIGSRVTSTHRKPRGPQQPIGTVRTWHLRNSTGQPVASVNYTKTPSGWMRTAAVNWLQHHNSIPHGYRVIHLDQSPQGQLNDDISNLALSPKGDIQERIQSSLSSATLRRRKRARGIAKANEMRGRINRSIEIKPGYWYPVIREPYISPGDQKRDNEQGDHERGRERGTIFMSPTRTRTINGWQRFRCGMLSIVRGLDLLTLEEYQGMRREVFEEIE